MGSNVGHTWDRMRHMESHEWGRVKETHGIKCWTHAQALIERSGRARERHAGHIVFLKGVESAARDRRKNRKD